MKITADLIPHAEFHKGTWLYSIERPGWYYFSRSRNSNIIKNKTFIKSVDGPLKELVSFLHKKNIKTTPSCAGHHISERNLEKIYHELENDGNKIRSRGLKLKNIETGQIHICTDKNYSLPWNKEDFIQRLTKYQKKGVLGIKLGNRKKTREEILKLKIDGAKIEEKDSIVFIFTENTDHRNNSTWKEVTRSIKRILN